MQKGGISNFPDFYGTGNEPLELTGGERNFIVNSIEVYQVLFYPELCIIKARKCRNEVRDKTKSDRKKYQGVKTLANS